MAANGASAPAAGERPTTDLPATAEGPRRLSGPRRALLLGVPLLILAATGCNACVSHRALEREIAEASRDPATGVILGTEAVDLGPADAEAACLLLHGFVGSRKDFADLGEQLAHAGYHVRMTRLPGHGTTPREFAATEADELVRAAAEELARLQQRFERVYLVGFSMGGAISTILAAQAPRPPDGLVLIAPYFKVTHYWYYGLPPMTWNALLSPVVPYVIKGERFVRVNRREAVAEIFSYRSVPTAGARTLEALGARAREAATLSAVRAPVLMLQAEGDEAASPAAGREAFAALGSPIKELHFFGDRSNHHLLWDYDGPEAKARVLEFLALREADAGGSAAAMR